MKRRPAWGAGLAATALLAVAAGCGGSGDKAGGGSPAEPLVLTLESEDDAQLSGAPEFAQAVGQLSGGSIRVDLVNAGRGTEIDFERGVVEDVRAGKAELGIVGARVWDTTGVTSFQALLAPFLVDSFELQRRVLESELAEEMLRGVEEGGVVGVALLPGPLRRPFGVTRALIAADDYRGATIALRPADLAAAALRALGATPKSYVPGDPGGADGVEADPTTIAYSDSRGRTLTANVVLWPKPYTIVMNREAYGALTDEQQELLRRAGRDAIAPELRQIEQDETRAVAELCTRLTFPTASRSELDGLRGAVRPVYAELERDGETKERLAAIEDLKSETPAAVLNARSCHGADQSRATSAAALEGTWETTWAVGSLIAAGIAPKDAAALSGHHVAELENGRARFYGDPGSGKSATAIYEVDGEVVRLVFETGIALQIGRPYELRWSVYRDSLTFSAVPGSEPLLAFTTAPYTRVP